MYFELDFQNEMKEKFSRFVDVVVNLCNFDVIGWISIMIKCLTVLRIWVSNLNEKKAHTIWNNLVFYVIFDFVIKKLDRLFYDNKKESLKRSSKTKISILDFFCLQTFASSRKLSSIGIKLFFLLLYRHFSFSLY